MNQLLKNEKNVIFILQAPELPKHIELLTWHNKTSTGVTTEWWHQRSEFIYKNLHQIPEEVNIFDPSTFFCGKNVCRATIDGNALYFDDDHLSIYGAK